MYVNEKLRPVETITKMGRGRGKENIEVKFKYDMFDIL
jgi:hypothetical protein